jgi:hypothetical protein
MEKKFFHFPLFISLFGTILLGIFYLLNWIADSELISYSLFCAGFIATGISFSMLKDAKPSILKIGGLAAIAGFTLWIFIVFHFLTIRSFWEISLSLIAFSLILGMYNQCQFSKMWNLIAQLLVGLLCVFLVGVIGNIEYAWFYHFGIGMFVVFSVLTLVGVFNRTGK